MTLGGDAATGALLFAEMVRESFDPTKAPNNSACKGDQAGATFFSRGNLRATAVRGGGIANVWRAESGYEALAQDRLSIERLATKGSQASAVRYCAARHRKFGQLAPILVGGTLRGQY